MASPRRSSPGSNLPFGFPRSRLLLRRIKRNMDFIANADPFVDCQPADLGATFDFFPEPPPAPAPGNPLLTDAETSMIQSSMDHVFSASHDYGDQNFGEGFNAQEFGQLDIPAVMTIGSSYGVPMDSVQHNSLNGFLTGTNYHSLSNVPPSTLSAAPPSMSAAPSTMSSMAYTSPSLVTSSPQDFAMSAPMTTGYYGQSTTLVSSEPFMNPITPTFAPPNGMLPDHRPSPPMQQHSPDVLEAATVLQGGSHHRSHSIHNIPQHRSHNQSMGPPVGHLRHQDMNDFRQERRRMSESIESSQDDPNMFKKWAFEGNSFSERSRQPRGSAPINLQYGSDLQFNGSQPYLPQSEKESFEGLSQQQSLYMNAVKLADSAESTRAPSPELGPGRGLALRTAGRQNSPRTDTNANGRAKRASLDNEPSLGRKRKVNRRQSTVSLSGDGSNGKKKRRKSAAGPKKKNLTDEQKRENHIASERKRREVIDVGFKNLLVMVPGLPPPKPATNHNGPAKAGVLVATHDFWVELTAGNAELRRMLGQA
ncbi:hypothetical protein N0V82_008130 [Gnomoniopsis sp. IMI 355080]|nr:hypothetical protein N0V82_008130 [Gnomoniopsis sp. IMI 355080]